MGLKVKRLYTLLIIIKITFKGLNLAKHLYLINPIPYDSIHVRFDGSFARDYISVFHTLYMRACICEHMSYLACARLIYR